MYTRNSTVYPGLVVSLLLLVAASLSAQPTITSYSPEKGTIGSTVTITGTGFSTTLTNNTVYFGAVRATVTAATATSLDVTVPAGANYAPLSVTVANLSAFAKPFVVTFPDAGPLGANSYKTFDTVVGSDPEGLASGDLDGDGLADVVVQQQDAKNIVIFRNTSVAGEISFASPQNFATPAAPLLYMPAGVAIVDLDGDGKLDVFVSINGDNASIFRNTSTAGTISFAARQDISSFAACGSSRVPIRAADLDLDGKPDIIVGCASAISVRRNTSTVGTISFASHFQVNVETLPGPTLRHLTDFIPVDVDGDGKLDIAGCLYDLGGLAVFRSTSTSGSLSFEPLQHFAGLTNTYSIDAADFDEDGKSDVVIGNSDMGGSSISLYKNTSTPGAIAFETKVDYAAGITVYDIAVGDINGDGHIDVATARQGDSRVGVHINNSTVGSPSFDEVVSYIGPSNRYALNMPDLDNDGKMDIISVSSSGTNRMVIMRNKINEPVVSSFAPLSAGAGVTVVLTGLQFTGATSVTFGGVEASSFTVDSPTQISAIVATGTVDGDVVVTTPHGTANKTGFEFILAPTITEFTPTSGIVGTVITITGTTLTGATSVKVGGVAATFTVESATSIKATLNVAASGDVEVITPGGTVTQGSFTAVSKPTITSISPANAPVGTAVQINGSGFAPTPGDNAVSIGGIQVTPTAGSATSLSVTVPAGIAPIPVTVTANKLTTASRSPLGVTFSSEAGLLPSSFREEPGTSAPTSEAEIAVGDFNNDGRQDVVVTQSSASEMSIFPNQPGTGPVSFGSAINIPVSTVRGVQTGDLDNDGRTDIFVVNGNNTISVFRNSTSGATITFDTEKVFSGVHGRRPLLADMDGDGRLDALTCGYSQSGVYKMTIYRNVTTADGTISFETGKHFDVPWNPHELAVGDLDADGKPDVAVIVNFPGKVVVFKNTSADGIISFATKIDLDPSMQPHLALIQDIDSDGKAELIVAAPSFEVKIYTTTPMPGTIAFQSAATLALKNYAETIHIGHIDGDGLPDIVATYVNKEFSVFRNVSTGGSPAFDPEVVYTTSFTFDDAELVDMNADGRLDLLAAAGSDELFVTRNAVSEPFIESFTPARTGPGKTVTIAGQNFSNVTSVTIGGIAAQQFTVESGTEIKAVVGSGASGNVVVTSPVGSYSLSGFTFYDGPVVESFFPSAADPGSTLTISGEHFNPTDIVWFGPVKGTITSVTDTQLEVTVPMGATYGPIVVTGNKLSSYSLQHFVPTFQGGPLVAASFADPVNFAVSDSPEGIASADFDLDGRPDLVTVSSSGTVSVLRNNSTTSVSFESEFDLDAGDTPVAIATADFDMDGKLDIAVVNSGGNSVSVFRNASVSGSMSFQFAVDFTTGTNPQAIAVGDLNLDGKPDIVTANFTGSGMISILRNTTGSFGISFAAKMDVAAASFPVGVAIGDLGGDGRPDIVVASLDDNTVALLVNNGSGTDIAFETPVLHDNVDAAGAVAVFDRSVDGVLDFVATETDLNHVEIFTPANGNYHSTQMGTGSYPYAVVVGDVNGDGGPDIVTANAGSSANSLSVIAGSGTSFSTKIDFGMGAEPVGVVICDLDGDGRADLASANRGSGNVSIRRNDQPFIASFSPTTAAAGTTVTITGNNLSTATNVKFGGTNATSFTVESSTTITAVVNGGSSGDVTVTLPDVVLSRPGFTFMPGPEIISFDPEAGSPGTEVTITGANLTNTSSVKFGGVAASSFTVESDATLKAIVGDGASGSISITTPGGVTFSVELFTYIGPPAITSFTPTLAGPGETVVITGDYLQGATEVLFGSVAAASFVATANSIHAVVATGESGHITVTTPVGTATKSGFTYNPTITGVNDGPTDGFRVYPNPSDGKEIHIDIPSAFVDRASVLRLTDMTGRDVGTLEVVSTPTVTWRVGLDRTLNAGVYVLTISSGDARLVRKVLVK